MSGLASVLGYGPGEYFGTGSYYADPVTGNHGAVAMLAALHGRRRTGRGRWIDMSLFEAVLPYFSQELYPAARAPNRSQRLRSPQGSHLARGTWLASPCRERDFAASRTSSAARAWRRTRPLDVESPRRRRRIDPHTACPARPCPAPPRLRKPGAAAQVVPTGWQR